MRIYIEKQIFTITTTSNTKFPNPGNRSQPITPSRLLSNPGPQLTPHHVPARQHRPILAVPQSAAVPVRPIHRNTSQNTLKGRTTARQRIEERERGRKVGSHRHRRHCCRDHQHHHPNTKHRERSGKPRRGSVQWRRERGVRVPTPRKEGRKSEWANEYCTPDELMATSWEREAVARSEKH